MKFKLLLALCGLALISEQTNAQRSCGHDLIQQKLNTLYPQAAHFFNHRAEHISAQEEAYKTLKQKTTATVNIPVVFHIVLNQAQINALGGVAGIQQRIITQMDVINKDFAKLNTDINLIPSVFQPLAAASDIRFGLAHRKPNGSGTDGFEIATITASSTSVDNGTVGSTVGGSDAKYTSTGGLASWDYTKYLNIWVINPSGGSSGLLGLTLPPSYINFGYPADEVGVVLNYGAFGKKTSPSQFFINGIDKGRTLTHEIGHFFELDHIWGPDSGCPPAAQDDGISDTPPQSNSNFGCPSFPKVSCSNGPNGDMFMNFMDYVNDACMQMFTQGQVGRMNSMVAVGGDSYSLTQHDELLQWPTGIHEIEASNIHIAPNPSTGIITIDFGNMKGAKNISVYSMLGQQVKNISINNNNTQTIDLSTLPKGVYSVQCTFAEGTITRKIILE